MGKRTKNLLIASTSTIHGEAYLSYLFPQLTVLFKGVEEILFIPYAKPGGMTYQEYTSNAKDAFERIGKSIKGIQEFPNAREAVKAAKGIFVGGGNTFMLVDDLYKNDLMDVLKIAVENGIPYLGTSAGSNIVGLTMQNTNDMPIVYPPSFETLGLINFNINAHYLDPDPDSTFMGETRETRINEFHKVSAIPVLGMREGSWLEVRGDQTQLKGALTARLFQRGKAPKEYAPKSNFSFLG